MAILLTLKDFHTVNTAFVYMKTEGGPNNMKALETGRARIDGEHSPFRIVHYLEYVGMATNEKIGRELPYPLQSSRIVPPGISSDMGHQNLHALPREAAEKRAFVEETTVVDIAADRHKRLEFPEFSNQIHSPANVARMPQFIHWGKKIPERRIEYAVGIGYETYHHS